MLCQRADDLRGGAPEAVAPDRGDRLHPRTEPVAIDPDLLAAWVAGRSLARGLPPPEADRGGVRVDVGGESEITRWNYAAPTAAITELTHEIRRPGYFVKLAGSGEALAALLAVGWQVDASVHCVMTAPGLVRPAPELPSGYRFHTRQAGAVTHSRILAFDGLLAAAGYAAEVDGAFVYDRIITQPAHQRRGLGRALMQELSGQRRHADSVDVLTATRDGRGLYESMGWAVVAPWATATVPSA